jgi:hypothetical protein
MEEAEKKAAMTRVMQLALDAYGSRQHLAIALNVSMDDLNSWIDGKAVPPHAVFLKLVDVAFAQAGKPVLRAVPRKSTTGDS